MFKVPIAFCIGMGLKPWIPEIERLQLGIKSYPKEWEWDLSHELTKMKDCDWELNQKISLRLGIQGIESCLIVMTT